MSEEPKDFSETPITVGSYMVQAFNLGRCAALKFTRVVSIKNGKIRVIGCEARERPVYHGNSSESRITWLRGWHPTKATTIKFPERSLLISPEHIPEEAKQLLDEGYQA